MALFVFYFLIPKKMFYGWYNLIAYLFILSTALTTTCIFRNTKERIVLNRKGGKSWFAVILSVFGVLATQVCGIGAPMCGAALGGSIGLTFLPSIAQGFFEDYAVYIIIIAILGQMYSLYILKCWGNNYCLIIPEKKV
jgi:hypothetical protein